MRGLLAYLLCLCFLSACAQPSDDPVIFLPREKSPTGSDLAQLRAKFCQGIAIDDQFLTPENFRNVFNCANYDNSLDPLKPLFTHDQFASFLKNLNDVLSSGTTRELKGTLQDWLGDEGGGISRLDRLLPAVAKIITNKVFQDALPVISSILEAGSDVWTELLPSLADLIYNPRYPDTFESILVLFENSQTESEQNSSNKNDVATSIKKYADFLQSKIEGKTVALHLLELADQIREVNLIDTTLPEYLDHMGAKGVFHSLYQKSGALRGELIDPKLNADPEEDELREGLSLSPAERQQRAYEKLFARGVDGEDPPIVQLAGLVHEFNQPHSDFLPALSRWVSANGAKISDGLFEYVAGAQVRTGLTKLNMEAYLTSYAEKNKINTDLQVTATEFTAFLGGALQAEDFKTWMAQVILVANQEQFGPKNATLLAASTLNPSVVGLYRLDEVTRFGATLVPKGRQLALSSVIKRFSNLHRSDKLEIEFGGKRQNIELHLVDLWTSISQQTLGESVVLDFALHLVQTLFTQFAADFGQQHLTLSQWYYHATYSNPASTEAIAGYAFKEINLLSLWEKNRDYLKGDFAREVFPVESDRLAWGKLIDQVPHIWLYIKSGMARSGNELSRALSEADQGYLINNYVKLIASAYERGMITKGVRIIEEYQKKFPVVAKEPAAVVDVLAERRKTTQGAMALTRVLNALFEPEEEGSYETSTLKRILKPLSSIVSSSRQLSTEKFMITACTQLIETPDKTINDFFSGIELKRAPNEQAVVDRYPTLKAVADFLKQKKLPDVVAQLNAFFHDDVVKRALDYFAAKVDDGSLPDLLKFIRRVLGFKK